MKRYFIALLLIVILVSCSSNSTPPDTCEAHLDLELCAKIGQMLMVGFQEDSLNEDSGIGSDISEHHVGGVLLYSEIGKKRGRNIGSPEQVKRLNKDLQDFTRKVQNKRKLPEIPLFIAVDQEGGKVNRFPEELGFNLKNRSPGELGSWLEASLNDKTKRQLALEESTAYAIETAKFLKSLNFNMNLAPSIDLCGMDSESYLKDRCFSSNPSVVTEVASSFIDAFNDESIIPTLKHFPGMGSGKGDTHSGHVDISSSYHFERDLHPFIQIIRNNYKGAVMVGHVTNGVIDKTQCKSGNEDDPKNWCPASMSKLHIDLLLRKKLGFEGVVISDDMAMKAITKNYSLPDAIEKSIKAGVDVFIVGNHRHSQTALFASTIARLVREKRIDISDIENSYRRIISLKGSS